MVSEVEHEWVLLRGLPKDYDVTIESAMSFRDTYSEAVSRLIVRATRLRNYEDSTTPALVARASMTKQSQKCFNCGKPGQFARDCRKKKHKTKDRRKCYKCRQVGHIVKNCPTKIHNNKNGDDQVDIAMLTVASSALEATGGSLSSCKWMLDSCCSKLKCINRTQFSDFVECDGMVQVDNNEVLFSYSLGTVPAVSMVDGVDHNVARQDLI